MHAMETYAITVALLALGLLLLGLGLLFRKVEAVRSQLAPLAELAELRRRLELLAAQVEQREFSSALQAKLTEFTEAHSRLAAAVRELEQRLPVGAPARGKAPPADLGELVRRHLVEDGFEGITILTDLRELSGRSGRVAFEARRRGVMHKGHALLQDGEVVDETLHAAYSTFP